MGTYIDAVFPQRPRLTHRYLSTGPKWDVLNHYQRNESRSKADNQGTRRESSPQGPSRGRPRDVDGSWFADVTEEVMRMKKQSMMRKLDVTTNPNSLAAKVNIRVEKVRNELVADATRKSRSEVMTMGRCSGVNVPKDVMLLAELLGSDQDANPKQKRFKRWAMSTGSGVK